MCKLVSRGLIFYTIICLALLIVISVAQSDIPNGCGIPPREISINISPDSLEVNRNESFEFDYNISIIGGSEDKSKPIVIKIPEEFGNVSILSNYDYDVTNRSITIEYEGEDLTENIVIAANIPKNATLDPFEFNPCDRKYLMCSQSPGHEPTCEKSIKITINNNKPNVDPYRIIEANNKTRIKPVNDNVYNFVQNHTYCFICIASDKDDDILNWGLYENDTIMDDGSIKSSQESSILYNASKLGSHNIKIRFSDGTDHDEIGPILVCTSKEPTKTYLLYFIVATVIYFIVYYLVRRLNKFILGFTASFAAIWFILVLYWDYLKWVLIYELAFYFILLLLNSWFILLLLNSWSTKITSQKNHLPIILKASIIGLIFAMFLLITCIPTVNPDYYDLIIKLYSATFIVTFISTIISELKKRRVSGEIFVAYMCIYFSSLLLSVVIGKVIIKPDIGLNDVVSSIPMGLSIIAFEYTFLMIIPSVAYLCALLYFWIYGTFDPTDRSDETAE